MSDELENVEVSGLGLSGAPSRNLSVRTDKNQENPKENRRPG